MRILLHFLYFAAVLVFSSGAFASPLPGAPVGLPPPPPIPGPGQAGTCEPSYMFAMENKAWMEGQREYEMAQEIILKADSVLELSCFEALAEWFMDHLALGQDSPQLILRLIVRDALTEYLTSNFGYNLGGGTSPIPFPGSITLPPPLSSFVPPVCFAMTGVWTYMKCKNFGSSDFQALSSLASPPYPDPRMLPIYLPPPLGPSPARLPGCQDPARLLARGANWLGANFFAYPAPGSFPFTALLGQMDAADTHLGLLDPAACASISPIPTGLNFDVITSAGPPVVSTNYPDAVCPAPGCYYNAASNTCN